MSRKHKNRKYKKEVQRRYQYIPKAESLLHPLNPLRKELLHDRSDKRYFYPDQSIKKSRTLNSSDIITGNLNDNLEQVTNYSIDSFSPVSDSRRRVVCRRRRLRRKILFAIAKVGKGKGGSRRRKIYNEDSKIKC